MTIVDQAVKTYMFRRFMKERLKQIQDEFSAVVDRRTKRKNALKIQHQREKQKIRSMDIASEFSHTLEFPSRASTISHGPGRTGSYLQAVNAENGDSLALDLFNDHFANHPSQEEVHPRVFSSSSSVNMPEVSSAAKAMNDETITLTLPAFPVQGTNFNEKHFYRRCVEVINTELEKVSLRNSVTKNKGFNQPSSQQASVRAGLLLVRGCYRLAEDNLVSGWDDLHSTAKEDARYFPEKIIDNVALALSIAERQRLQQKSSYKVPPSLRKTEARDRTQSTAKFHLINFFNEDDSAIYSLTKDPFTYILEKNDVTTEDKIISLMYEALSDKSTKEVDAENFNAFFQTWKQLKDDCEKAQYRYSLGIRISLDGGAGKMTDDSLDKTLTFHYQEKVLKVSSTVPSSKGNGRLVLTSRRVLFFDAGNQDCKCLIDLQEILHVKLGKLKNFMSSTPALIIVHQYNTSSPLKVGLKSECELWCHLINEMKTGKNESRDKKDHMITLEGAVHNVMLANAFYISTTDESNVCFMPIVFKI